MAVGNFAFTVFFHGKNGFFEQVEIPVSNPYVSIEAGHTESNGLPCIVADSDVIYYSENLIGLALNKDATVPDYKIGESVEIGATVDTLYIIESEPDQSPTATFDLTSLELPSGAYAITVMAKADGYVNSAESEAVSYVVEAVANTYNITTNLVNCSGYSTNPTEIDEGESVTLQFMPNDGYSFPTSIYVSGAEYYWFWSTGELVLRNPTGPVYVSISCATTGNTYDITVSGDYDIFLSTNPTQISENETVTLVFSTVGVTYAIVEGADCTQKCEPIDFIVGYKLTVTLSNPTSDVTVIVKLGYAPPEL